MTPVPLYLLSDASLSPQTGLYASGTPDYLAALPPWWSGATNLPAAQRPKGPFGFEWEKFDADAPDPNTNKAAAADLLINLRTIGNVNNVTGLPCVWSGNSASPTLATRLAAQNQYLIDLGVKEHVTCLTPMVYWGGPSWTPGPDGMWRNVSELLLSGAAQYGLDVYPMISCDLAGQAGAPLDAGRIEYTSLVARSWFEKGQIKGLILFAGWNDAHGRQPYNAAAEYPGHKILFDVLGLPTPAQPQTPPPQTVAGSAGH